MGFTGPHEHYRTGADFSFFFFGFGYPFTRQYINNLFLIGMVVALVDMARQPFGYFDLYVSGTNRVGSNQFLGQPPLYFFKLDIIFP